MTELTPDNQPNIAFAGLTAAGKTTHAKILAEQLGYKYVSATKMILDIIGIDHAPDRVWFTNYEEIEKAREGDMVDIELEARMQDLARKQGRLVLDTWAMAWIYDGPRPMIRVWMESDATSRTKKCYVSQDGEKTLDLHECNNLINKKDTETRDKFLRRLDFDLFNDKQRYDAIIDNTRLIPEPTAGCSQRGIESFSPVVHDVVSYMIDRKINPNFDLDKSQALSLIQQHNGMIKKLGEVVI